MILSQALIDITGTAEQLNPLYPSKYAGLQFVFTAGTKHFAKIMCAMENASTLICTACVIFLVRFSSASFSGGFKNLQTGKTAPLPKNLFLSLHPCTQVCALNNIAKFKPGTMPLQVQFYFISFITLTKPASIPARVFINQQEIMFIMQLPSAYGDGVGVKGDYALPVCSL